MRLLLITIAAVMLSSCTDAERSNLFAYGDEAEVKCYSGGQVVYQASSTGKVISLEGGGWAFRAKSGEYVQTYADCFVLVKP